VEKNFRMDQCGRGGNGRATGQRNCTRKRDRGEVTGKRLVKSERNRSPVVNGQLSEPEVTGGGWKGWGPRRQFCGSET